MTTQKPEIGKILTEAYQYWIRTLPFQLLFSIIYFSVIMFAGAYAFRYYGLFEQVNQFSQLMYSDIPAFTKKYEELMKTENALYFTMVILVIKSVIFPLNIGFLKIYRKLDICEPASTSDLFAGFQGHYFFLFLIYSLFWNILNSYILIFPPLSIFWMGMMMFVPAFAFYKKYNFFQAFRMSVQVFQKNIIVILLACLASILISYSGIIAFFFGIFLTFPFWNAVIYVLYKNLIADFEE